jgi:hypothetical protein
VSRCHGTCSFGNTQQRILVGALECAAEQGAVIYATYSENRKNNVSFFGVKLHST